MDRAKNSEVKQLRDCAQNFKINKERCSSETIKTWIKKLKLIKIGGVSKNDIRRHMNVREM